MVAIELPFKSDIYRFTGLPRFEDSDEGQQALNNLQQKQAEVNKKLSNYKTIQIISIILAVLGFFEVIGIIFIFPAVIFRSNGKKAMTLKDELSQVQSSYNSTYYGYADHFVNPVADQLVSSQWHSYRTYHKCLIYSDQQFAYFDLDDGTLVAYNTGNIKEVSRERLHTGSYTQGDSSSVGMATVIGDTGLSVGSAQTNSYSNTTDNYEWHFDILKNFIDYPKFSLVLADSPSVEDFVGKAYAILKP